MKIYRYLACALATVAIASCSNEEVQAPVSGEVAALEITVKTADPSARAVGNLPGFAAEAAINKVSVLVFNNGSYDAGTIDADPAAGKVKVENSTSGTRDLLIVANAPAGTFTAGMTKQQALDKIVTLNLTPGNLVMAGQLTGKTLVPTDASNEVPDDNKFDIALNRLGARIALTGITKADQAATCLTVTGVYMTNINRKATVPGIGSDPLTYTSVADAALNGYGEAISGVAADAIPYFYTGPNKIATDAAEAVWQTGTQLVIVGKWTDASGTTEVKYPVRINRKANGTSITGGNEGTGVNPNTAYTVAVTIKKKGGSGEDLYPAPCEVTITASPWDNVSQDVEF